MCIKSSPMWWTSRIARCFIPENVAKKQPRTSLTLQTPRMSTKGMPLQEKVLNLDFEMTNTQLKFIIFVGAYIVFTLLCAYSFSDVQRCWFIHLFYSLMLLKSVTAMSCVINQRPTKSVGLGSSEHCEYLFRSRRVLSLIDKCHAKEKVVWPHRTTVTQRYSIQL